MVRAKKLKGLTFFVVFCLIFCPFLTEVLRADQITLDDLLNVTTPLNSQKIMLKISGTLDPDGNYSQAGVEARAWSEFFSTMSVIYDSLGTGAQDAVGYYGILGKITSSWAYQNTRGVADLCSIIQKPVSLTIHGPMYFGYFLRETRNIKQLSFLNNLIGSYDYQLINYGKRMESLIKKNCIASFIDSLGGATPNGDSAKEFWKFTKSKDTYKILNEAGDWVDEPLSASVKVADGIAGVAGISLAIIGMAMDASTLLNDETFGTSRTFNYGNLKTSLSLYLNYTQLVLTLMSMIIAAPVGPVIGAIATIAGLVYWLGTSIGDAIGESRRKWLSSYKRSYEFLLEVDPEFQTFVDEYKGGHLSQEAKPTSMIFLEESLSDLKTADENGQGLFASMEKQAMLSAYYELDSLSYPSMGLDELKKLWKDKADYLSYKPTEEEIAAESEKSLWENLGDGLVNAWMIFSPLGQVVNSFEHSKEFIDNYQVTSQLGKDDIQAVFFNPDYYLTKKFRNYYNDKMHFDHSIDPIWNMVSLRLEQAPFNYLPLIEISSGDLTSDVLVEAFAGDSIFVAAKEMEAMRKMLEISKVGAENILNDEKERIQRYFSHFSDGQEEALSIVISKIKMLKDLLEMQKEYNDYIAEADDKDRAEREFKEFNKQDIKDINRRVAGITSFYKEGFLLEDHLRENAELKAVIKEALNDFPKRNAKLAVEVILGADAVKTHYDTLAIIEYFYKDRKDTLAELSFSNEKIRDYIEDGKVLGIQNNLADFFGDIYSAKEDLTYSLEKIEDEIEKFRGILDAYKRIVFESYFSTMSEYETYNGDTFEFINKLQSDCEDLIVGYNLQGEKLGISLDLEFITEESRQGYFPENGFGYPGNFEPIDPSKNVDYQLLHSQIGEFNSGGSGGGNTTNHQLNTIGSY